MASLKPISPKRRTRLWPALVTGVGVLAIGPAVHAGSVTDVNLTINPQNIPCGSSGTATVVIEFEFKPGETPPPFNKNWVRFYSNYTWPDFDRTLGFKNYGLTILNDDTAIEIVTFDIHCSTKSNGKCTLSGAGGTADGQYGSHDIYAQVVLDSSHAAYSNTITVTCVNTAGTAAPTRVAASPSDSTTLFGEMALTAPAANFDWTVTYDPAWVVVTNAMINPFYDPMFMGATFVDFSIPGTMTFAANSPIDLQPFELVEPLWIAEVMVLPGAPYGPVSFDTTETTTFSDMAFQPLGINRGNGGVAVVPDDTTPPSIDTSLITVGVGGDSLVAAPGTVSDDQLALDDYIEATIFTPTTNGSGEASLVIVPVATDGSFQANGVCVGGCAPEVEIRVRDEGGNDSTSPLAPGGGFPTVPWYEDFDDYDPGSSLHGGCGWRGWDDDPAFDAPVTDALSRSESNSVQIDGDADIVRAYCTDGTGLWTYEAWQYIPSNFTSGGGGDFAGSYFLLLNTYDAGGPYNWSVQMQFDSNDGLCKVLHGEGLDTIAVPYETDRWVKIQAEVDLDNDWTRCYYDDNFIAEYTWTGGIFGEGGGALDVAVLDLYAGGSTTIFYDDLSLNPGGIIPPCPWDLDIDTNVGTTDLLDLLAAWGPNPGHAADFDGDGIVGTTDLLKLLASWGPCP